MQRLADELMFGHSGRVTGNSEVSWNRVEMSGLPTTHSELRLLATLGGEPDTGKCETSPTQKGEFLVRFYTSSGRR